MPKQIGWAYVKDGIVSDSFFSSELEAWVRACNSTPPPERTKTQGVTIRTFCFDIEFSEPKES